MPPSSPIAYNASVRLAASSALRPAPDDTWQARRAVAAALRRLNDASLTTDAAADLLRSVAAVVEREAERLEAGDRVFGHKAQAALMAAKTGETPDLLYELSPAIGQANAVAPPMRMWQEDGAVHALVTPGWSYEGPYEHLHGGIIMLLFDQLLGAGQRITGSGGRTGTLSTRFTAPTPVGRELRLVCRVDRIEGRKKFMVGEMWVGDLRTATCEGVFIADRDQPTDTTDTAAP
jgi:acyl-coenzyme A thioesterase PaaI-like protein